MATGLTPQLPLNFGGEGDFALIKVYEDLVKQNLKNLMLTIPGERTMDSNFGAGIQRFLFEPNLPYVYADMKTAMLTQIEQYMPFVTVQDVQVAASQENENLIKVELFYVIEPLDSEDTLLLLIEDLASL